MATYQITGMNCMKCVQKIQDALSDLRGIAVTLNPPRLTVPDAQDPGMDTLNTKISAAGSYSLSEAKVARAGDVQAWARTYYPLLLIIGYIFIASFHGAYTLHDWMIHFMAGFFLVFSFFKLLDLDGFADAYASYDLLAKKWHGYGYIYPFLELGLGICFLFRINLQETLLFTIVLMAFSSIGVIKAVRSQQEIRCACLGTALNLPMSTVTIVEDVGMTLMAALMFFI